MANLLKVALQYMGLHCYMQSYLNCKSIEELAVVGKQWEAELVADLYSRQAFSLRIG